MEVLYQLSYVGAAYDPTVIAAPRVTVSRDGDAPVRRACGAFPMSARTGRQRLRAGRLGCAKASEASRRYALVVIGSWR